MLSMIIQVPQSEAGPWRSGCQLLGDMYSKGAHLPFFRIQGQPDNDKPSDLFEEAHSPHSL